MSNATLTFGLLSELTTCAPATIALNYTGPPLPGLFIYITSNDLTAPLLPLSVSIFSSTSRESSTIYATVTDTGSPSNRQQSSDSSTGIISHTTDEPIANISNPSASRYTWPAVDVPQGFYRFVAIAASTNVTSQTFFVSNGTNTSCLRSTVLSPSSTSRSSISATTTSLLSAETVAPTSRSSTHSHSGSIAGGVIGAFAFISAVLGIAFYYYSRRRSRTQHTHTYDGVTYSGNLPARRPKSQRNTQGFRARAKRPQLSFRLSVAGSVTPPQSEELLNEPATPLPEKAYNAQGSSLHRPGVNAIQRQSSIAHDMQVHADSQMGRSFLSFSPTNDALSERQTTTPSPTLVPNCFAFFNDRNSA
jgi:hypothetical protein